MEEQMTTNKESSINNNNNNNLQNYNEIRVTQKDRILLLEFNRPAYCNAFTRRTCYEIIRAINYGRNSERINIIVLTGVETEKDKHFFTSGNDLKQARNYQGPNHFNKSSNHVLRQLVKSFIYCRKVLIAIINGPCIGIGFTLSALCDIIYCEENAYFEAPFTRLGICPEACSTYLFPKILGHSKAAEILLFGEKLTAQQALQFNFVSQLYRRNEIDSVIWTKIMKYSLLPLESISVTKRLMTKNELIILMKSFEEECKELDKLREGEIYRITLENFINRKGIAQKSKI